ncbi:hypothetical protein GCK72_015243 [Caenorhabditis remanei]|uniref:Uncharacterized protein n=1 Tax=Caenorhabditis remanei TaxID=31234 RepID=A0A6A5GWI3_CAERE|nr:hypothetical protein GCK72_015243 [Caenorhabditis remanei]KAF1758783.1 hypothetical protein GCK72_015243 [Caenorhabditis remanei]
MSTVSEFGIGRFIFRTIVFWIIIFSAASVPNFGVFVNLGSSCMSWKEEDELSNITKFGTAGVGDEARGIWLTCLSTSKKHHKIRFPEDEKKMNEQCMGKICRLLLERFLGVRRFDVLRHGLSRWED